MSIYTLFLWALMKQEIWLNDCIISLTYMEFVDGVISSEGYLWGKFGGNGQILHGNGRVCVLVRNKPIFGLY